MIMWQKLGLGKEDHGLEIHNFYNDRKFSWQKNVKKCYYVKIWIIIVDDNVILKTFQIIFKTKNNNKNMILNILYSVDSFHMFS
jgi:hypothetical protein